MSVTDFPPPLRAVPFRAPTARLALRPEDAPAGRGGPDGVWWPRSRDLPRELSALADVLDPLWGRIDRVTVDPRHWQDIPAPVVVNGYAVQVGRFASGPASHGITLLSCSAGRWNLLVIPPETEASSAARLMVTVSAYTGPSTTGRS
ncbi:DUF5994 family protein [Streptomyces sp. NPDC029554]|uniref:DUF5994 family protein n=1 Tax=unclassified Streptomyces TaxID=2593676 RepID=UPI0033C95D70